MRPIGLIGPTGFIGSLLGAQGKGVEDGIMRFDVLTLFPDLFQGYLTQSLLKLAIQNGLVQIHLWNLREWAADKHHKVDDRPFGGGPGMVLMPEPVFAAVEAVQKEAPAPGQVLLLTPAGQRLEQD